LEFLIPSVKIIHIIVSIVLVLIILLQPSKSSDIGSMFGGGSSESVFGSSGAMPFLVKMTRLFGLIFVITSLFLGYTSVKSISGSVVETSAGGVFEELPQSEEKPLEKSVERTSDIEQAKQLQEVGTVVDTESMSVSSSESVPVKIEPELRDSEKKPRE